MVLLEVSGDGFRVSLLSTREYQREVVRISYNIVGDYSN